MCISGVMYCIHFNLTNYFLSTAFYPKCFSADLTILLLPSIVASRKVCGVVDIYIDADACPVQKETWAIAEKYGLTVFIVKSYSHFSHDEQPAHVQTILVDKGADMADYAIIKRVQKNDIVITQDYGLASICLGKGCHVLHHKGFYYTEENIDRLLSVRHVSAAARRAGQRTKGPRPFTDEERKKFVQALERLLHSTLPPTDE